MSLIDADEAATKIASLARLARSDKQKALLGRCVYIIEHCETVDAEPVRHGRWVFGENDVIGHPVKCSECGIVVPHVNPDMWVRYAGHKYCGACGVKMDGEAE